MGMIYKRGHTWWIKYYQRGKPICESSKSHKKMPARKLLEQREGEIAQGKIPGYYFDQITFAELADDFVTDYRINHKKSMERAEIGAAKLKKHFEGKRAPEITTAEIRKYIDKRLSQGAKNATINRELAALKRMFSLGAKCTPAKVTQVPHIPMLEEKNVRHGFFEHRDYLKFLAFLPDHLRPVVTFAYKTGWRRGEILCLTWDRVDLKEGVVRLEYRESKNDAPRNLYLDKELQALMRQRLSDRRLGCPYVFHRNVEKIIHFDHSWETACRNARIGNKLFHDFRRTAVRNMVRGGIPERVAMMISGHKTRSVFDRYNIVSPEDLRTAAFKQEAYLESLKSDATVTNSGTISCVANS